MSEHIVTLSVEIDDALSGQDACNKAYHMMRKSMKDMQFIVTNEDGEIEVLVPLVGPMLRLVEEGE